MKKAIIILISSITLSGFIFLLNLLKDVYIKGYKITFLSLLLNILGSLLVGVLFGIFAFRSGKTKVKAKNNNNETSEQNK